MLTVILLVSTLAATLVAWLLRGRLAASTLANLPRKETLKTIILLGSVGLLATIALLPDLLIMLSTLILLSRFSRIAFTLLVAAVVACIGCSKQPEPPQSHEIHWHGPETGYDGKTIHPPDNAGKPREEL